MAKSLIESVADTTAHRDRGRLRHAIASLLRELLDADTVTMYGLLAANVNALLSVEVAVTRNDREFGNAPGTPDATPLALGDRPEWCACMMGHEVVQYEAREGVAVIALPMTSERGELGLIVIETPELLGRAAIAQVGAILRIQANHLALLDYGERDTLTGLLNRKTFDGAFASIRDRIATADARAVVPGPSWLALADIDLFKSINDSHGHLFGDEVLLLIAQVIQESFRRVDQIFRFGGEEFLILLDAATPAGASIAFERLRASIEATVFPQIGRITISLGYSRIEIRDGPSTCVERADAALYYVKQNGRNQVRAYDALAAAGKITGRIRTHGDAVLF
jgi:diguanylate cyclase (GGDEF)-like protein